MIKLQDASLHGCESVRLRAYEVARMKSGEPEEKQN
jgi:hypothetical protein